MNPQTRESQLEGEQREVNEASCRQLAAKTRCLQARVAELEAERDGLAAANARLLHSNTRLRHDLDWARRGGVVSDEAEQVRR